jgi:hypothetical protein
MRNLIDIVSEASLDRTELSKHDGAYLRKLIELISAGSEMQVDPGKTDQYGDTVIVDASMVPVLQQVLDSGDIKQNLPREVTLNVDGKTVSAPWSVLFKSAEFTGREFKQPYNAGHLAELMMGLAVTGKFANHGGPVTVDEIIQMAGSVSAGIVPGSQTMQFSLSREIDYPRTGGKTDQLTFVAKVPYSSAEQFIKQMQAGKFDNILQNVFSSAVRYANESEAVDRACARVRSDKNSNRIDVLSDGVKGTKADLTLKIDGSNVRLLSLKTFSTETLGQISGVTIDALNKWFKTSFGLDISKYSDLFDPALGNEKIFKNVLKLYSDVIYPVVKKEIENQSPGQEAKIVRQLAAAANYHARGEDDEDVDVVKLDDKIKDGNYKILKFSDDLYEAMKHLDLEASLVDTGENGRTIIISVKPKPGEKVPKGSNRLCKFRTQKMGKAYRNYYEIGPMMEKLTELPAKTGIDADQSTSGRLTGPGVKAVRTAKDPDYSPDVLGRSRRR